MRIWHTDTRHGGIGSLHYSAAKSSSLAAAVQTGQPVARIVSRISSLTSMVCVQSEQVN